MIKKIKEFTSCKRKRKDSSSFPPYKKSQNGLACELCKETVVSSKTLPCGDTFCEVCINEYLLISLVFFTQKCPVCNYNCQKAQAYPCFLLDEIARCEVGDDPEFQSRVEKNKQYKGRLKLENIEEGLLIDAKDAEGIWCKGKVKIIIEKGNSKYALIHYEGWDDFFDELICVDSPRLAPLGSFTSRNILRYKLLLPDFNKQAEVIR